MLHGDIRDMYHVHDVSQNFGELHYLMIMMITWIMVR